MAAVIIPSFGDPPLSIDLIWISIELRQIAIIRDELHARRSLLTAHNI